MIRLHTFGGLRLDAEMSVHVQRMRLALLAIVAASGSPGISRDRVIALLWPESDDTRGRGALKQAVHALRRDLAQPDLFVGVDPLRLNAQSIISDVAEFDAALRDGDLERAVQMYTGPFLSGFHVSSVEFEEWQFNQQTRLARRYHSALEQLARSSEREDDTQAAVRWWRALAQHDPLSAPVALSLMRALVRNGDPTGAIHHADVHAAHVQAALHTGADSEIPALADTLRQELAHAPTAIASTPTAMETATVSADAVPAVSVEPAPPRRRLLTFVAAIASAFTVALLPFRPYDANAVNLRTPSVAVPHLDSLVRAGIEAALLRGAPDTRVGVSWRRRPRFEADVQAKVAGDSVMLSGIVHDVLSGQRFLVGPVGAPSSDTAVASFAEAFAVAIAAVRSPLTQRWGAHAALPRSFAAFKAFEAALSEWRPPFNRFPRESLDSLTRAHALDPTSGATLALRALILIKHGDFAPVDSILTLLADRGVRKTAWERGVTDVIRAWKASDLVAAHRAGHRLLDSVPNSEWAVMLAYDALGLGYADEAVTLLGQAPRLIGIDGEPLSIEDAERTVPEAITSWKLLTLGQAYYHLGAFDRALDVARVMLSRNPEDNIAVQSEIKALAGLGRTQEVEQVCRRVLARSRGIQECQQAMIELRGRGHSDAARRVAATVMESLVASDSLSHRELEEWRAFFATRVGDWDTASRLLQNMTWEQMGPAELRAEWLMVLAQRGDTARLRTLAARLEEPPDVWTRAQIAAMSGAKAQATELVAEGFRQGRRRNITLLVYPGLQQLVDYAPFQQLIKPLPMSDHVNALRRISTTAANDRR